MSELTDAIDKINASAAATTRTTTFFDEVGTASDSTIVTNPNNGKQTPSIKKQVKDQVTPELQKWEVEHNAQMDKFDNEFYEQAQYKPAIPWAATTQVSDKFQLYSESTNRYRPNPSKIPFTTGATINDDLANGLWLAYAEATLDQVNTIANAGDSQLASGKIWPVDAERSATNTDTGLVNVINLRDATAGVLYGISNAPVSGDITAIDFDSGTATIGGSAVTLQDIRQSSEHMFDSIASMKNANGISKDAIDKLDIPVGTMSYYSRWGATTIPFGSAKYTITTLQRVRDSISDQAWEPDGFGDHYLSIGDGSKYVAMLVNDECLNVQSFGFIPDNIERSNALQAALNYADKIGAFIFIPPAGTVDGGFRYRINKTIHVPLGMNIRGGGPLTLIFAESGGTYVNNFAFLINTTDGNDAIVKNSNFRVGTISNAYFAAGDNFIKCFAFSGAAEFYNVRTQFFATAVKGSSAYNDHVTIRRCNFATNVVGADYQIQLDNLGDGCVIDQVQMANVGDSPLTPQRSIKISGCRAKITNCLYGIVYLSNMANSTSIENCGMDGGYYIIERSNVSIRDSGISALEPGRFPIILSNDTDFSYKLTIDNLIIGHDIFRGLFEPSPYDIKLANNYVVDVKNMVRRVFNSNAPASYNQLGVKMELESGAPFDEFNDLSHFYSTRCTIMDQKVVSGEVSLKLPSVTLNYFSNLAPFQSDAWDIASGTYFYRITCILG